MRESIDALATKFRLLIEEDETFIAKESDEGVELKYKKNISLTERIKNCELISDFLVCFLRRVHTANLTRKEFKKVQTVVDNQYDYVRKVISEKGVDQSVIRRLRAQTVVLKLGGRIPLEWILKKGNENFLFFIKRNHLHHIFFTLRFQLPFDQDKGPSIPIHKERQEFVWIPFNQIKMKEDTENSTMTFQFDDKDLFVTDFNYCYHDNYSCFYNGLQKYNQYFDKEWLPFDKRDPKEWENKYILEICTGYAKSKKEDRPSMLFKTHAYLVLLSKEGYLYSVGQDAVVDIDKERTLELMSKKPGYGKILTPDSYVFFPTTARKFWKVSIELSKEQFEKLKAQVEADKEDKNHSISLMKNNCVSYIVRLLEKTLGYKADVKINGLHMILKASVPDRWYRKFLNNFLAWANRQHPIVQKSMYFFPPVYVPYIFIVLCVRACSQNSFKSEFDYTLKEVLFKPWNLQVDHPLILHRFLEKKADKDGFIRLNKDETEDLNTESIEKECSPNEEKSA